MELFKKMDLDGDGNLTFSEAQKHFKKFAAVAAKAMFKEVRLPLPQLPASSLPSAAAPSSRCSSPRHCARVRSASLVPPMRSQVDVDGDKTITVEEFKGFFVQVMEQKKEDGSPLYTDEDVIETIDDLMSGEAWVDCARARALPASPRAHARVAAI